MESSAGVPPAVPRASRPRFGRPKLKVLAAIATGASTPPGAFPGETSSSIPGSCRCFRHAKPPTLPRPPVTNLPQGAGSSTPEDPRFIRTSEVAKLCLLSRWKQVKSSRPSVTSFASPRHVVYRHMLLCICFVPVSLLLSQPDVILMARPGSVVWYPATALSLALMLAVSSWYVFLACESVDFSLRNPLGEVTSTLRVRAQQKGLKFACHIPLELPDALIGDPSRLRQIMINLLGNALKFTARGEVTARVAMEAGTADQAVIHFSVRDTGIGIPQEKQKLIFEAFTQSDSSTTREYGGTGLGLSISSRLVALMGGNIWVESQPGEGSTFHFKLRFGLQKFPAALPAR